jgi:hypothetical protein
LWLLVALKSTKNILFVHATLRTDTTIDRSLNNLRTSNGAYLRTYLPSVKQMSAGAIALIAQALPPRVR